MGHEEGFADREQRRARKSHVCELCHGEIHVGQEYIRHSGAYCGQFFSEKTHVHCDAIGLAFLEKGADEYSGEAIRGWIGNAVCPGCQERGRCGENPFPCRRAIEALVPETYRGAALHSLEGSE